MKLTETQKNFRKQMAEIDPNSTYNNNHKSEPKRNLRFPIILFSFFSLAFLVTLYKPTIPNFLESTQSNTINNRNNVHPIPNSDAAIIDAYSIITNNSDIISKQNQIPFEQRDLIIYKKNLMDSIVLCDYELDRIISIKPSNDFLPAKDIIIEYINNKKNAYKYYLDYINTRKSSDNELGNKYLSLSNKSNIIPLLKKIFEENNYTYTNNENKSINFYVKK